MTSNNPSTVRPVAVLELPLEARFNLRVRASDKKAIEAALGFALPDRVGSAKNAKQCTALCLGPDEWVPVNRQGHFRGWRRQFRQGCAGAR